MWCATVFQKNSGLLLDVFAYISVILSAIQPGLATDLLGSSAEFHRLLYTVVFASMHPRCYGSRQVKRYGGASWVICADLVSFVIDMVLQTETPAGNKTSCVIRDSSSWIQTPWTGLNRDGFTKSWGIATNGGVWVMEIEENVEVVKCTVRTK